MTQHDPENLLAAGRRLLEQRRYREALVVLGGARDREPDTPRYASFYGLGLVKSGQDVKGGKRLCERAARQGFYDPEVVANLVRVLLVTGNRRRAHVMARRGLKVDRNHRELRTLLESMGVRRRPVFPFLERRHPLNRWVGRLRHHTLRGGPGS